jgi:hypothetical protein
VRRQSQRLATARYLAGKTRVRWFLATALPVLLWACGGSHGQGPDSPAFAPAAPLTLAWDQPDGLADYFLVKSGATMLRVDQRRATLTLTLEPHVVHITSCNEAGCSEPTSVAVVWQDDRWALASP